jgi:hypothetical protein
VNEKIGIVSPVLILAGLTAALYLFFARLAFSGEVPFYRDAARLYYPARAFMAESFARGALPAWFPYEALGVPFIGQVVTSVWHPLNLLYAALPFDLAFAWNHLLAYGVALFGAYGLSRRLGLAPAAAAVAGAGFAFTGYLVSMTSNLPYLLGASSAPLWLWALDVALERRTPLRVGLAGAALALAVLGGDPQGAMLQGLVGIAWAARRGWRGAAVALASCAAGAALAAAQIVPAFPAFADSARVGGVSAEEAAKFALAPSRLIELFAPISPARGAPFADAVYAGLAVTLLALYGAWKNRPARFWLVAAAVFIWLSLGPGAGLERTLRAVVPLWDVFRYSEKHLAYAALALAVAAAHGAAALPSRALPFAALAVFADLYLRNEGVVKLTSPSLLRDPPAALAHVRRGDLVATYYGARPPPALLREGLSEDEALTRAAVEALAPDLNALHGIRTLNNYLPAMPRSLVDASQQPDFWAQIGRHGVRWIVAYEDPPGVNAAEGIALPTGATLLRIEPAPPADDAAARAAATTRARFGLALTLLAALTLGALALAEKRHRPPPG